MMTAAATVRPAMDNFDAFLISEREKEEREREIVETNEKAKEWLSIRLNIFDHLLSMWFFGMLFR